MARLCRRTIPDPIPPKDSRNPDPMRRPATVWLLDLLGLGYAAYLAAAFLAALGILVDPGLRFPFAGLGAPDYMQGRSFLGRDIGDGPACVMGARDRVDEAIDTVRCVRDKRFLYARNFYPHLSHG